MHIQVELTNYCNLRCVECPNRLMKRPRAFMDTAVFDKVLSYVDAVKPQTIILHKDGEPLLHPELFSFVQGIGRESAANIDIYTNGLKMTEEIVTRLVDSVENKFRFLITFHLFNEGGIANNYEKVKAELLKIRNIDRDNLEIILCTHVTDSTNKEQLNEWQAFWEGKKTKTMDAIHVNANINPWTGLIDQENTIKFDACPYMDFAHLFIGVTGNVIPCCMDLEEKLLVGNIMTDDREKLFAAIETHYETLKERMTMKELCRKCINN